MLHPLKSLFARQIKKLGLTKEIAKKKIFDEWENIIVEVVGEKAQNKSKPLFVKNKILFIDCLNSVWAAELQARAQQILEKIHQQFGDKIVKGIRFIS